MIPRHDKRSNYVLRQTFFDERSEYQSVPFPSSTLLLLLLSSFKYKKINTRPVKTSVLKKVNYQGASQQYLGINTKKIMGVKSILFLKTVLVSGRKTHSLQHLKINTLCLYKTLICLHVSNEEERPVHCMHTMTQKPRDSKDIEPLCYILNLFKQTECVDRKSIHHKALQIQIEDTEYQDPEQRVCENIGL